MNSALFDLMQELMQGVKLHSHVLIYQKEWYLENGETELQVVFGIFLSLVALEGVGKKALNLIVFLILLELFKHFLVV